MSSFKYWRVTRTQTDPMGHEENMVIIVEADNFIVACQEASTMDTGMITYEADEADDDDVNRHLELDRSEWKYA